MRHIATNELWLQEKIRDGDVIPIKIKNIFNVSDLLTKPQPLETITSLMELLDHRFEDGRSAAAPDLNALEDNNGLAPMLLLDIGIHVQHL